MLNLTKFLPSIDFGFYGGYDLTEDDVDANYAPISLLNTVGAALCFVADVVASPGGWDRVAVVGYPTRRSFVELAAREDFQNWHERKQAGVERTAVFGTLPLRHLPVEASSPRILLELWDGLVPQPVAEGPATQFDVEGTIIGDGRQWTGARYTALEPGTALPLEPPPSDYQALLLEPRIVRWR
jgi:hypothetical protein